LWEVEEAAVALHRVDEAEDRIEAPAVGRIGLPGDDLAGEGSQHLTCFGDEFRQQIIHRARPQVSGPPAMTQVWLRGGYVRGGSAARDLRLLLGDELDQR